MRYFQNSNIWLFFLIYVPVGIGAQFSENLYSAQQISQGLSNSLSIGLQSLYGNPGGLSLTDGSQKFIASSEKRFWTDILGASLGVIIKIDTNSAFGFLIGSLGIDEYRESSSAFVYGRRLSRNLLLGAKFEYDEIYIDQHGRKGSIRGEIGISVKMNSNWQFGLHVKQFPGIKAGYDHNLISISAGMGFELSDKLLLFTEIEKTENIKTVIKSGFTYTPVPSFSVFVSIVTNPSAPSFGLSTHLPINLILHLGFLFHPHLGMSTGLSFIYKH